MDPSPRSPAAPGAPPFWQRPLDELQASLGSSAQGLSAGQARQRLQEVGPNVLDAARRQAAVLDYLLHFRNPLVLLLLAASAVAALLGDVTSFALITVIVACSVTLDFVQERRAGNAMLRLRQSVALLSTVWRDGSRQQVPAAELVPGDVVELAAGDLVPADGRVIEARDFFLQQAMLTGESFPVEKSPGERPEAASLVDASNAVFMGSSVLSGSGRLLVCRTGAASMLGGIAHSLREPAAPTAFELGTRRFGQLIVRMTFVLVLFVAFVQTLGHRPAHETFMFAVALAVGLTPELLPMIVSVTLARGAMRLSRSKVIVKRLSALQDLGSMDVLCTDKTGTLTEAAIRLEQHVDVAGRDSARVLELACLNSQFESGLRSPLDEAILAHAEVDLGGWTKIDEVPFGFGRRRVSVLAARGDERLLVVKGAPEDLMPLCESYEATPGAASPLDGAAREQAQARFDELSRQGLRVLAIASRAVPAEQQHAAVGDERRLVLCGFATFLDPPRAGAAQALARLRRSGVEIKVLTGDTEGVARHLCGQLGLPITGVLTGAQLEQLDDPALAVKARDANLFCRVSPPQKSRILRALRAQGRVVGFLGDGINDAPSLHEADVGISVDSAVDVAREAADMILLERGLGVLHVGVLEGRRTFTNVMKYIMMATSSNFGNMVSVAAASLFLPFLPLLPVQILLNNLLYDTSELPLPLDEVDPEDLRQPRAWDAGFIRRFMLVFGPLSSLFDLLTFGLLLLVFHAGPALFRTGWFIESIATQVLVIFVIRTRMSAWHSAPHPWLGAAALAVVCLAIALPFTPVADLLGFEAPPLRLLLVLALLVVLYLATAEMAKRIFYGHAASRTRRRRAALRRSS